MARLTFPSDRLVYQASTYAGSAFTSSAGATATVYSDANGTTLADVQNIDGTANPSATFTVDTSSRLPLFLGPANGSDTLYVKVGTGPVTPIYAVTAGDISAAVGTEVTNRQSADALLAKPRGAWAPTTAYAVNDVVISGGTAYRCLTAHTSGGSFSGAGVNWESWGSATSVTDDLLAIASRFRLKRAFHVNTAGGTGIYSTIGAALTALHTGAPTDGYPQWAQAVMIDAGDYPEQPSLNDSWLQLVGTTGNYNDVVLHAAPASNGVVFEVSGASILLANFTIRFDGTGGGHPLRDNGAGGWIGGSGTGYVPRLVVHDNMRYYTTGMDDNAACLDFALGGGGGIVHLFNRCVFDAPNISQAINLVVNNSGTRSNKRPNVVIFNECTVNDANGQHLADTNAIGVVDAGDGAGDVVVWIGPKGDPKGGINSSNKGSTGADIAVVGTTNASAVVIIDPAVPTVTQPASNGPTVIRARADARYLAGLIENVFAYYSPQRLGCTDVLSPTCPATEFATFTANRCYLVPVRVTHAAQLQELVVGVGLASGSVGGCIYADDGTGKPSSLPLSQPGKVTAAAGRNLLDLNGRVIFPGMTHVWVGVVADNSTVTLASSTMASVGGLPCYYQDITPGWNAVAITPASLTQVPVGTAVPVASIQVG